MSGLWSSVSPVAVTPRPSGLAVRNSSARLLRASPSMTPDGSAGSTRSSAAPMEDWVTPGEGDQEVEDDRRDDVPGDSGQPGPTRCANSVVAHRDLAS